MGRLVRLNADGTGLMTLLPSGISGAAGMDFGSGALNCNDLYIASRGSLTRFEADTPGLFVPWH
jgi:hypothetical protein